jgi:hypothetical protein
MKRFEKILGVVWVATATIIFIIMAFVQVYDLRVF